MYGDARRLAEVGGGSGATVSTKAAVFEETVSCERPCDARHGGDDTVAGNLADEVVGCVGDEQIAGPIHRDTRRLVELGGRGGTAIAAKACRRRARHRADHTGRSDPADAVVFGIGDEKVSLRIDRYITRLVQLGGGSRAAVSAEAKSPVAGHSRDDAGRIDLANAIVEGVGEEQIAFTICRHARGRAELSGDSGSEVSAKTSQCAVARHGGNDPGEVDLADAL